MQYSKIVFFFKCLIGINFLLMLLSLIILGAEGVTLTLLHVNDIHSHFEEVNVNTGRCRGTEVRHLSWYIEILFYVFLMKVDGCYGGMSRMMTFIREVRTSDPDTILLNAGDYYQVRGREGRRSWRILWLYVCSMLLLINYLFILFESKNV